jgi:D-lyxose ketol-isomerase
MTGDKSMLSESQISKARDRAATMLEKAGFVLRRDEKTVMEVADFALGDLDRFGLEIVVYVNTDRCCAKELVMFPGQICPQHRHPPFGGTAGKEETFRCRWGEVYLYVPGEPAGKPNARVPQGKRDCFSVWHEIVLRPGDQYTLGSDTWHWFQAGPEGAIVSEFSTQSRDDLDVFLDPQIRRT